jgi:hypothetical protein
MFDLLHLILLFLILFCGFFAIWFVKISAKSIKPLYTSLKAGKSEISELDSNKEVHAIEGKVKKHSKLIRAPFSGNKCVAYRTAYEKESPRGEGMRLKTRYTVMKEKIESVPFVIQDSTGEVIVDPNKDDIEVRMSGTDTQFRFVSGEKSVDFEIPEIYSIEKFKPPEDFDNKDQGIIAKDQRMIETRIEIGDTVTAFLSSDKEGVYTNDSDRRSSSYPEQIIDLPWTDAVNGLFRQSIYYLTYVGLVLFVFLMFYVVI